MIKHFKYYPTEMEIGDKQPPSYSFVIEIDKFFSVCYVQQTLSTSTLNHDEPTAAVVKEEDSPQIIHGLLHQEEHSHHQNFHLFLRWLKEEILKGDKQNLINNETTTNNIRKIILSITTKRSLTCVFVLTNELKRIMREDSVDLKLREEFLQSERFRAENHFWPSQWFISVKLSELEECPSQLWQLQQLEHLDMSNHSAGYKTKCLEELPPQIGLLKDLKYLNIERNNISELPSSLQYCKKLEVLLVGDNEFTAIPIFLLQLQRVKRFHRKQNNFTFDTMTRKTAIIESPNFFGSDEDIDDEDMDDENKKGESVEVSTKDCDSLKLLCLDSMRKQFCQENSLSPAMLEAMNVPKHLKVDLFEYLYSGKQCDECHIGISENQEILCQIAMDDLFGCKYVPMVGVACSIDCAVKLKSHLDTLNTAVFNLIVPVYSNEEENVRKNVARVSIMRRTLRRIRKFILRR